MKRRFKRVIAVALTLTLTIASSALMQACGNNNVAQIEGIDPDGMAITISGFMQKDIPVPYVDIVEYMNIVYDSENTFSLSKQGNGVYKISNAKGEMLVDTAKDTLHSDKIEQFLYNDQRLDPKSDEEYVFEHIIATDYREDPSALDIDLSKYKIDIIEKGGKVYFPLTTAADLTNVAYINTVYYDNKINFIYGSNKPDVNWTDFFNKEVRDASEIVYTYSELCFVFDNIYGNAPHCILADSIKANGLDATLENYSEETKQVKELLNSDKTVDLVFGLIVLSSMLCDGGHTDLSTDILLDLEGTSAYSEFVRIQSQEPDDPRTVLFKKWYAYSTGIMSAKMLIEEYDEEYDKYQAIFDEETEEGQRYRYYEYNNTGIFVYTNYDENVVRNFKKALTLFPHSEHLTIRKAAT